MRTYAIDVRTLRVLADAVSEQASKSHQDVGADCKLSAQAVDLQVWRDGQRTLKRIHLCEHTSIASVRGEHSKMEAHPVAQLLVFRIARILCHAEAAPIE